MTDARHLFDEVPAYTFVLTQLEAGGAQNRVLQTAAELRARGVNALVVFLYKKRDAFPDEPYMVLADGKSPRQLARGLLRLYVLLRNRGGVVVCNTAPANVLGTMVALAAGSARRYAVQTQPPSKVSLPLRIADVILGTFGGYSRVFANSNWTAAQFARYPRAYRQRVRVVLNGAHTPREQRSQAVCREALGWDRDGFTLLSVGRLSAQKGHDWLLRALSSDRRCSLKIAGDGELREHLVSLAEELGVSDRVEFIGEVSSATVRTALRAADVLVFPSRWETFGLAAVEAMAQGTPIIASDLDVLREVLDERQLHEVVAFVPVGEHEALASAIARAASGPPSTAAIRAAQEYSERFSIERHVDRLLAATSVVA